MSATVTTSQGSQAAPRLLDQLRQRALARFGRPEPAQRYCLWVRRFVLFHGKRHPRELGAVEAIRFLEHLAASEKDPLLAMEQAREALLFLYDDLLHRRLGPLELPEPPRLLDRMRRALRAGHYSPRTEKCYLEWTVRYATTRKKGDRHRLPERPYGCCAQSVPVPFFPCGIRTPWGEQRSKCS